MKVYKHLNEFQKSNNAVATIGTFDGVHIGHRKIISRLVEDARNMKGESVILTFFPHPRMILHPEDESLKLITTIQEKTELIESLGVDHLIITPFTRDFSNLSPESYIEQILIERIGIRKIIIGYDHRFGKDRAGNFALLQHYSSVYNYEIEKIAEQDIHDVAVSSTKVREALLHGDVKTAADFLGYPFHLTGKVIKGDQIGRKIGYPTANLLVEEAYKLIPADGIYAATIEVAQFGTTGNEWKGMAYIGNRPTINGMLRNIEVNIFDFDEEIYGKTLRLHFHHFVRGDMKFNGLDELRAQISRDKKSVMDYFG
ncbi:riboflavin kinase/FMN adenylyltransferase [Arcticibacter tournemirensis]|uniref:Riboflavin biosynthesis protein n=1 Tax=Arcticibacter tournemirensis TaxID=699437 RepID=A0A5M9H554_9SPHI|nr:bifunctional riboflavin kinase/FAD synthetase [Arcticibacter tournemirensis]KAA8482063.1 bifunctional riboflavin kinase/FAD synthetase [Arcticibacter tournemirensis]TQM49475.1 riboflavin kinase/FMN adenylyltransferase [Arcticibacter tournemirensis]